MTIPARPARLPANHQLVYEVLRSKTSGRHVAAADIYADAKAVRAGLGCSTVYRALKRLCELGLVVERHVPGMNATLYEAARSGDTRLVCGSCGRAIPVRSDPGPLTAGTTAADFGLPEALAAPVHGRCLECQGA